MDRSVKPQGKPANPDQEILTDLEALTRQSVQAAAARTDEEPEAGIEPEPAAQFTPAFFPRQESLRQPNRGSLDRPLKGDGWRSPAVQSPTPQTPPDRAALLEALAKLRNSTTATRKTLGAFSTIIRPKRDV